MNSAHTANESFSSIPKTPYSVISSKPSLKKRSPSTKKPKQKGRDHSKPNALRINMKINQGRKNTFKITADEKEWLIKLLNRSDNTCADPGSKDHVFIGKLKVFIVVAERCIVHCKWWYKC